MDFPLLPRLFRAVAAVALTSLITLGIKADSVPSVPTTFPPHRPATLLDTVRLRLHHLHTGESIDVAYKQNGLYLQSGIDMLNHFLRDHRTNDKANYDPREFDLLHSLLAKLGRPNATIDIVCGYRTPWSNNFLRTRSAATGVAEHSQHILSKAIDIQIPGVSTKAIRDAALSLGMGGVGYYPTSHFVHVDVGPVRQWQFGGMQLASRGSGHRGHSRRHRA
ncbi:DUF882 domain-containing protein [Terriglobus aquaticus]|uniref:Murein endopeptidase K n=1 Tax=Terriglobus aquaticus TaxID=940139 RepID=A0ABW9KFN9_9BACT|nr:DUF882 domain-containing protein [Terriglobus aquaticus]